MPQRYSLAFALLALALGPGEVLAQAVLRAGPMLGYATMREVAVWVQTDTAIEVQLRYWPIADATDVYHSAFAKTQERGAYCATLIADSLHEGTAYVYEVLLNHEPVATPEPLTFRTQTLWEYRSDPPAVTFALGSCYYANEPAYDRPGRPYGGGYGIFEAIDSLRPDFMLWLGDNIYLRTGDFDSRSGILHRYSHSRAVPELQGLLRHTHHYAIWDDHDYGPNDADRTYVHKDWTRGAWDLFWANPPTAHPSLLPGIGTHFRYGDADFFLLDDRTFRAPNECKSCPEMPLMGDAQLEWLVEALVASDAAFKFVAFGNQVLSTAKVWENYVHHHGAERERLLARLEQEQLNNVVFLTGDRHHTELTRMERGGVTLYDFTVSPLTSGATGDRALNEGNTLRVEGTHYGQHNFGTVTLAGPRKARTATLRVYDERGGLVWERVLE